MFYYANSDNLIIYKNETIFKEHSNTVYLITLKRQ